jgi:hypothetical protein
MKITWDRGVQVVAGIVTLWALTTGTPALVGLAEADPPRMGPSTPEKPADPDL